MYKGRNLIFVTNSRKSGDEISAGCFTYTKATAKVYVPSEHGGSGCQSNS